MTIATAPIGRPDPNEAAPYYFTYIDCVVGDDPIAVLEEQLATTPAFYEAIGDERSLHRYAPGKWSVRDVLRHVTDVERLSTFRGFWFARGFDSPLPSFDQDPAVEAAKADDISLADHIEDFRAVRKATLTFFRSLRPEAWHRTGTASGNLFSVRALAYVVAGHATHHERIVSDRYL